MVTMLWHYLRDRFLGVSRSFFASEIYFGFLEFLSVLSIYLRDKSLIYISPICIGILMFIVFIHNFLVKILTIFLVRLNNKSK